MKALRSLLPIFVAGCLSGDFNGQDQGVTVPKDMTLPIFDIAGLDLSGATNCSALNMCIRNAATPAQVQLCKNMATPQAKALENNLESCFLTYCPGSGVCMPDSMGMLSVACQTCISNTYIPAGGSCSPTQNPSECHNCLDQANACTADM
jgi:hypothetical protein